jgi:hypothetical protein
MGYFGEIWIMQLDESGGTVENVVEYIEFLSGKYVSWEGSNLPKAEWIPKGKDTLYLRKGGFEPRITDYHLANITPVVVGAARKHTEYRLQTSLCGNLELSLLQTVLPDMYIPNNNSLSCPPSFTKKQENRIALTWVFSKSLETKFQFKKVNPKEFYDYKSVGIPDTQRVDPEVWRKVKYVGELAKTLHEAYAEYKKYAAQNP